MEPLSGFILNELNNLVVVIAPTGKIKYANKYTFNLLGISASAVSLFEYRESIICAKNLSFEIANDYNSSSNKEIRFEKPLIGSKGNVLWIDWKICIDAKGNLVGIGYDITDKKKTELQMKAKTMLLEEKQNDVISSIQYAQRIQESLLPDVNKLTKYFNDITLYYKPRDYVSGDFYWITKKENFLFIAVADCTGHGVPGAMMAVMGHSLLNTVIKKHGVLSCDEIMHELDSELHLCLNHKGYGARDGMDLALLRIDLNNNYAQYCGAMRNIILVRGNNIEEITGSKYPLGFYDDLPKYFASTNFQMEKGNRVYLYSDGYSDQFGGDRNKKFNKRAFKELILSMCDMSMEEQNHYLDYVHDNWKQKNPQTDDITVLGIEL